MIYISTRFMHHILKFTCTMLVQTLDGKIKPTRAIFKEDKCWACMDKLHTWQWRMQMEQASIYSFQTKPIGRYLVSPRNCATLQITQASINRLPTKPVIGLFSVSLNEQAQTVGHGSLRKKLINAIHVKALKKRFPTIFEMHSTFT